MSVDSFLEHCMLPAIVQGSFLSSNIELPLAGITGFGGTYKRGEKKSTWITGEIISPVFIDNGGCACRSHIEGTALDNGELHLIEQVYNFIAREGDCFVYSLNVRNTDSIPLKFEGTVTERSNRNGFQPQQRGIALIELNPFWSRFKTGKTLSYSLPYNRRAVTCTGVYMPQFFNEFLGIIEEKGYEHPYMAVTEKLKEER